MDLKKLFSNNKAVSPVIGVVLMVAITVILAAAIGSSVFGQGSAKSAPQANINAKFIDGDTLVIEHLGGDTIVWENTQIRLTREDGILTDLNGPAMSTPSSSDIVTVPTDPAQFSVGDLETFIVSTDKLPAGKVYNVKITDKLSNQLICDKTLRT